MESENYIIQALDKFITEFPRTRVRYEHDKISFAHIIEIIPSDTYHNDDKYIQWEDELFCKFIDLYPTENICFITDDSIAGIENPIYTKEGLEYAPFTSIEQPKAFSCVVYTPIKQTTNNYIISFVQSNEKECYHINFDKGDKYILENNINSLYPNAA